jgi:hypothetical protein
MLRLTCGDYSCVLSPFEHKAAGAAWAPGIPCALRLEGHRQIVAKLGRYPRRGNVEPRLATDGTAIHPRHARACRGHPPLCLDEEQDVDARHKTGQARL